MFLDHVYRTASEEVSYLPLGDKKILVTDSLRRECKLIRMLHILSIGVFTVLGTSVSGLFGEMNFFRDVLVISVFLAIVTFLYNKISFYLIKRKFANNE